MSKMAPLLPTWCICGGKKKRAVYDVEDYGEVEYKVKVPPPVRSSSCVSSVGGKEAKHTIDGKVHLIWDVDDRRLEEYLRKVSKEPPEYDQSPKKAVDPQEVEDQTTGHTKAALLLAMSHEKATASIVGEQNEAETKYEVILEQGFSKTRRQCQDRHGEACGATSTGEVAATSHGLKLMYSDGDQVEYFSETYKMWMPATVHPIVKQVMNNELEFNTTVMYDVRIQGANRQEQQNVKLHNIRKPFEAADLLEVYSLRDEGQWLPARATQDQASCATLSGYQIALATDGKVLDSIPSLRLRWRFPAGLPISVYAGSAHGGWRDAEVLSDPSQNPDNRPRAAENGITCEPVADVHAGVSIFWTMVSVKMTFPRDDGPDIWNVPSYLVRSRIPKADMRGRVSL